ncbi:DUF4387 domain-containing protein [Siminovitchia fortis]|uniref:DUF4387 domain-containing protein n=1 Tax=Siminovitchia fortis TaxID=254758 RepID=UPI00119CC612|nr:DUF4387 domain-containing protein [Siminovitchia fortis]
MGKKVSDLAEVVRSKNAGPFELTVDILFSDQKNYDLAKHSGSFTKERIASLYGLRPENIVELIFFDAAKAIKITLPRLHPSGSPGERDTYGAQQYVPILNLPIRSG